MNAYIHGSGPNHTRANSPCTLLFLTVEHLLLLKVTLHELTLLLPPLQTTLLQIKMLSLGPQIRGLIYPLPQPQQYLSSHPVVWAFVCLTSGVLFQTPRSANPVLSHYSSYYISSSSKMVRSRLRYNCAQVFGPFITHHILVHPSSLRSHSHACSHVPGTPCTQSDREGRPSRWGCPLAGQLCEGRGCRKHLEVGAESGPVVSVQHAMV